MNLLSFKQYVKYAMPVMAGVFIMTSALVAPVINQKQASAAGLKTVADCRKAYAPGPTNPAYVSCVNKDTYEAMIFRSYKGLLGRYPEANPSAVLGYWVPFAQTAAKNGKDPAKAVAEKIMSLSEYKSKDWAKIDNDARWVNEIYKLSLNRPAEAYEAYYWAGHIGGDAQWTRARIAVGIIQSAEAKSVSQIDAPCYVTTDACADQ